jgi:hypothetical protein
MLIITVGFIFDVAARECAGRGRPGRERRPRRRRREWRRRAVARRPDARHADLGRGHRRLCLRLKPAFTAGEGRGPAAAVRGALCAAISCARCWRVRQRAARAHVVVLVRDELAPGSRRRRRVVERAAVGGREQRLEAERRAVGQRCEAVDATRPPMRGARRPGRPSRVLARNRRHDKVGVNAVPIALTEKIELAGSGGLASINGGGVGRTVGASRTHLQPSQTATDGCSARRRTW